MLRDVRREEEKLFGEFDHSGIFSGNYYTEDEKINKIAKEWNENKPNLDNFVESSDPSSDFSLDTIKNDKKTLATIKSKPQYRKERNESAIALEYIIMEVIHGNNALGKEVNVYPASEFDDVVNHIDFVVRFPGKKEGEFFYLGVDVTTTDEGQVLDSKLNSTLDKLENNSLDQIKYFIDEERDNPVKGKMSLPRVVINVTGSRLLRVIEGFKQKRSYALDEDIREELIEEIKKQLEKCIKYLLTKNYNQMAEIEINSKGANEYFKQHGEDIRRNKQLYKNSIKHIGIVDYLQRFEEKENPVPEIMRNEVQ